MRFYWVRDRVRQGQFLVHWKPGLKNLADYYTKHFSPKHHQTYLHETDTHPARHVSSPEPRQKALSNQNQSLHPRSVMRVCS
jgi:hypothetical protein